MPISSHKIHASTRRKLALSVGEMPFKAVDIRQAIRNRLMDMSPPRSVYWLANCGMHDMSPNTIYRYLGKKRTDKNNDMNGANIGQLLAIVGLVVMPPPLPKR